MIPKLNIVIMVIITVTNISSASTEKLKTRAEFEKLVQQQQAQIKELKTTVSKQKKELLDLKWKIYHLEHKPEPNETGNTKAKQSENPKLKTIIQDQKKQIQRFRTLFQQMGINPDADVNSIPIKAVKYAIKDYNQRAENYKVGARKTTTSQWKKPRLSSSRNRKSSEQAEITKNQYKWEKPRVTTRRHVESTKSTVPTSVLRKIQQKAASEWPDDYQMQKFTIEQELSAYRSLHN